MLRAQTIALALLAGAVVFVPLAIWLPNLVELFVAGESRELEHEQHRPAAIQSHSKILFIGMDGVGRDLLYEELRQGRLPELAALLGGQAAHGEFPHAHLDETLLSTLPSTTMAAWATTMTGVAPAEHGVTGNDDHGGGRHVLHHRRRPSLGV
jgi:predicted AlkP superfamily pyrophosphatase or phosphodiesterase